MAIGGEEMPAPLSMDLRKRIVEARKKGDTVAKIAREKNVCTSTINKLLALYQETGEYTPRPLNNGRKPRLTTEQLEAIKSRIIDQPDISLLELITQMQLPLCVSALCRIVNNKLGFRRKKKRFTQQSRVVRMSNKNEKNGRSFKK
jgi:transposase